MGLPEVADYARNFAVMVRVQGPDPKGLKMRNQAFHHYNSGKTTLSASGMLLGATRSAGAGTGCDVESPEAVFVLTVASVVEPFLLQQYRTNMSKDRPYLIPGAQIDVLVEGESMLESNIEALSWLHAELLAMVNIPQSYAAVQSLIEASCGSLENGWEVGWSLASRSCDSQHISNGSRTQVQQSSFKSHLPLLGVDGSKPYILGQSTTRIALLTISSKLFMSSSKLQTSVPRRGDLILAMGSPFGILSPVHFLNNISVGSVSNIYPSCSVTRSLLMADIRCLPGMEGSPVFNENARFIGLLTRPLRQNISGTEIQLIIPWEAIAAASDGLLQEDTHILWKGINDNEGDLNNVGRILPKGYLDGFPNYLHETTHSTSQLLSPVEKAMSSICLITTDDGSWASGVLLNKQGLVLTNAHLLEPWRFGRTAVNGEKNGTEQGASRVPTFDFVRSELGINGENFNDNLIPSSPKAEADISLASVNSLSRQRSTNIRNRYIRVRLDFMDPWLWTDASIVFISKGPLDIALLQLENAPDQLCPISMDAVCPSPGSPAYVIGHGLFGPRCDFLPSTCLGVVSRVIEVKRLHQLRSNQLNLGKEYPAMIETTAAVHPGSSGGAVVNSDGRMIGLVTSNAKHGGGTVIPHLNFSIPCDALEPILKFSEDMHDLTILEELNKPNEQLSSVWALVPPLYPKPQPLLPIVPQIPAEDNSKHTKGSRFAKFIADRNELLKKTQHGMAKSFANTIVPSKL